jgi:hypothetical protein
MTSTQNARSRRWTVAAGALLVGSLLSMAGPASLALAQSPRPNVSALDFRPSTFDKHPTGVVVEAVGSGGCSYPWKQAKATTVRYIRAKKPTWTELSPQSQCASLKQYEQMISGLVAQVKKKVPGLAATYWAGIMLDEEPNFGFSASQVTALNTFTANLAGHLPGVTNVFSEDATWAGAWSQSQYNAIVGPTVAAPQVYNSYMVGITNRSKQPDNLVTWTKTVPAPFNDWKYVVGRVKGRPYENKFGTAHDWSWSNQWQGQ